ncbi:MAG TPA: hypothetical protein VGP76_06975 [Planctomycetaceae bacterium]|nr:hypothetical protein [Planctomycetaceae bacterium]
MEYGSFLVNRSSALRAILCSALTLSAAALFAEDEPILGPPPAPAAAPATPPQVVPPTLPPPADRPQLIGPPVSAPKFPRPATTIPLVPVPQAPGKTATSPPAMTAPTVTDPAMPAPTMVDPAMPGETLLNPDGTPFSGSLTPVPEGAGPPSNPGPPRLRTSEEKENGKEIGKDPKPIDAGTKAIPASLVFRTRDIVRPDLLRGKNYRLADYTPLVDFNFRFEIETPWGTIPAHGMAMLDLRLRELCSLEYGSRIAEKNPMFSEGFAQAICHTPQGAYIFATDPIGSVRRTGQALKRMALYKKSPGGCKANCEPRRRLACLIGCDPETRNEPLECLLDDMSINASGGWLTVEVGLNFGLPGLGFLPANTEFKKMMEHRSTLEIQLDLDTALTELGVPEASRTRFFASQSYTTTQRMAFVYYLRKLIGIENLACLVDGAADTRNESEALASIRELQLIVDLRRTRELARVTFIGVPVLTLDDGTQIIVTVADYLVETPRTAQMIATYRKTFAEVPTKLATLGRVSLGAQKQFTTAGIEVIRHKLGQADSPAAGKEATRTASAMPGAPAPPSTPPAASPSARSSSASPAARS